MVSKRAYIDHLRGVRLFADCTRKELELIASSSDVVTLRAGRTIIEEGKPGKEAFVILSGTATIRKGSRRIRQVGEGAIVGELALFDGGARSASVVCDTDCEVLVLSRGSLMRVLESVPPISHKLLANMAGMVRDLDKRASG